MLIRNHFQAQRWFTHFTHALAQGGDVFSAQVRVQAESHLQFIDWLGRYSRRENLVEPFERVVIALEPGHTLFHRQSGFHRIRKRTNSRERWEIMQGRIALHNDCELCKLYARNLTSHGRRHSNFLPWRRVEIWLSV